MTKPAEIITVTDDERAVTCLLEKADDHPLVLEHNSVRYVLSREDPWAYYDADAVLDAVEKYAGLLTAEEAERMKEQLYRAREEGSRSSEPDPVPAR